MTTLYIKTPSGEYVEATFAEIREAVTWPFPTEKASVSSGPAALQEACDLSGRSATHEWKPIETAPKDGSKVLLWWSDRVVYGAWLDNSKTAVPWAGWRPPSMEVRPRGQPTYWMPLPAPPTDRTHKGAVPTAGATEDYCGIQQTIARRWTDAGTEYQIAKWICPNCSKACSCIYVDNEWCHGDSLTISFGPEKDADGTWTRHHKCNACWLPGSDVKGIAGPLTSGKSGGGE